jgi:hypothetical protein
MGCPPMDLSSQDIQLVVPALNRVLSFHRFTPDVKDNIMKIIRTKPTKFNFELFSIPHQSRCTGRIIYNKGVLSKTPQ